MPALLNTGTFTASSQRADQVFYPSCVTLLSIRLEEAYQTELSTMPSPVSVDDTVQAPSTQTQALSPDASTIPDFMTGGADALTVKATERIPKHLAVELPGYRLASKFNAVFDFRDIPVDPRQIRAIGIEIHLGAVRGTDFANGIVTTLPQGGRSSIIKTRDAGGQPNPETLLFMGTVDTIHWKHNKECSEITLDGRDLRGILLDSPIRPDQLAKLDLSKPIDKVVQQIINFHPFGSKFNVKAIYSEWPNAMPTAPGVQGNVTRVRLGAAGVGAAGPSVQMSAPGAPHKVNMWDMITKYCYLVGAVPYFVGQTLMVRRARNIFETINPKPTTVIDPNAQTPFLQNRNDAAGNPMKIRRMVYGSNILDLEFERKIGGVTIPVVELVCVNTSGPTRGFNSTTGLPNKLLRAQFPPLPPPTGAPNSPDVLKSKKRRSTKVSPNGKASSTDILTIPVHGIASQSQLQDMAEAVWNEIARQEVSGKITTKNLTSLYGGNSDPDMLRLRPGDPLQIIVRSDVVNSVSPVNSELIRAERFKQASLADDFNKRTGQKDPTAGQSVARTAKGSSVPQLQNIYRVSNVKMAWAAKSGIQISADFQNYVEAIIDAPSPTSGLAALSNPNNGLVTSSYATDSSPLQSLKETLVSTRGDH